MRAPRHLRRRLSVRRNAREAIQLLTNYELFLSAQDASAIDFSPGIAGAGFVERVTADLAIGSAVYEVKTVVRNIAGKDIRQLLVYLAFASGNWKSQMV